MTKFIVIEKDSLNKATIDTANISLNEASIIHTKMSRDDVAEFVRDGNNLVLKLKNGETIVIEGFFITYDNVSSDLVFEEDGCVLYWFDGTSGFNSIPGLEVLLPEAGSKLLGLLPWLVGAGVIGGVIAATNDDDDKKENIPNGKNFIEVETKGTVTGKTENIPEGADVKVTITGQDKNGNPITHEETVKVGKDGNYTVDIPEEFADGNIKVESEVVDRNGNIVKAEDNIEKTDHDNDPSTPDQGGLDRVDGAITAEIDPKAGTVSGTVTDVPEGEKVIVTIEGVDKDGNPVKEDVETTVVDGKYTVDIPAAIVDGSPVEAEAKSTDNNGKPVTDTATLEGKTDHDNDPSTPDQGGLDRVDGAITVKVDNKGNITGGTTDVKPGSEVKLTITGQDKDGNPLVDSTVTAIVQPDGRYTAQVPAGFADGDLTVKAETEDRNGKPVEAEDNLGTGKNDDPTTPGDESAGLDRVDGSITVDIVDTDSTQITGITEDVAPNSKVTLEITSIDENGETRTFTEEVFTNADGEYSYTLTPAQGNATEVVAKVDDRNEKELQDSDQLDAVVKADPSTDINNGDNDVVGTSGNDVLAGDTGGLKTNFVAGSDYNVSIILDLSGSMAWNLTNNNTAIPPALSRLDIAKAGLKAFVQQMVDHDGSVNLQLVSFSASGNNTAGDKFNKTFLDVNQSSLQSILDYIDSFVAQGGTYPERGFERADDWFDTTDISSATANGFENQTYFLTDGDPNGSQTDRDNAFRPLAEKSKVFAVGISDAVNITNVERYDNTDVNGNKLPGSWNGSTNHGSAQKFTEADKLIAYLIGGSENFIPADVGNDIVKGGAGDDILFGDAMNTDWITGLDPLQYPKYSGYSKLLAHLKANVTSGAEPTQQEIYDFVKANFQKFIDADTADAATKGGNDTIYGGSGNDIIIAGAGDDRIYGGSGDDIISTGRGNDTIVYDVLNAADAMGGNGTDTWVDYAANDKIEFGADFFEGLLADKSNISEYIKVEDVNGKAVLKVDRDGAADSTGGTTHDWADLLIIEGKTASELQDLINNQIIIG